MQLAAGPVVAGDGAVIIASKPGQYGGGTYSVLLLRTGAKAVAIATGDLAAPGGESIDNASTSFGLDGSPTRLLVLVEKDYRDYLYSPSSPGTFQSTRKYDVSTGPVAGPLTTAVTCTKTEPTGPDLDLRAALYGDQLVTVDRNCRQAGTQLHVGAAAFAAPDGPLAVGGSTAAIGTGSGIEVRSLASGAVTRTAATANAFALTPMDALATLRGDAAACKVQIELGDDHLTLPNTCATHVATSGETVLALLGTDVLLYRDGYQRRIATGVGPALDAEGDTVAYAKTAGTTTEVFTDTVSAAPAAADGYPPVATPSPTVTAVPTVMPPGGAGGAPPATLVKAKRIGTTYRARVDCPQGCAARLTIRRHHRTVATKLITLIPGEHRVQVTYAKRAHRVVLHVRNPQSGNYVRRGAVHLP